MVLLNSVFKYVLVCVIFIWSYSLYANKLLILNGINLTMKRGEPTPYSGYILVGDNGKIKAMGQRPPAK